MIVHHMRYGFGLDSTLGRIYVDDAYFGFTLEDELREIKVPGETAIPAGTYSLDIRHDSPKFGHYDQKWEWHDGMLWLQNVPDFSFVYLHPGNDDDDTDGCILPGTTPVVTAGGEFEVSNSRTAYERLYRKIRPVYDEVEWVVMNDLMREEMPRD